MLKYSALHCELVEVSIKEREDAFRVVSAVDGRHAGAVSCFRDARCAMFEQKISNRASAGLECRMRLSKDKISISIASE